MLDDLTTFFTERLTPAPRESRAADHKALPYAAAALLVVCARSDFQHHPEEKQTIEKLLKQTFSIDEERIEELMFLLDNEATATSLNDFTRLVNRYYSEDDKHRLLENLWRVAFADGRLDKFEEQYIARVAFLIHLPQSVVQECRQAVEIT